VSWKETVARWDANLSARLRTLTENAFVRGLAAFAARSGDWWFWVAGMVLLWVFAPPLWKWRAIILTVGMFITGLVVLVMKYTIRRPRPEGEWGEFYRKTDPHSFPSGHAARSMLLPVLGLGLGPIWFGLLLLAWWPLIGLGRVARGVHYMLDVVVGWLVGLGVGLGILVYLHRFF
jgi:undecaprenyl-diphosphatase